MNNLAIVINIKGCKDENGQIDISKISDIDGREIVYVGRACKRGINNWQLDSSIFRNPFSVKKYGLTGCIRKYISHVYELLENIENLEEFIAMRGKALACWCKPDLCHGDVLCYILNNGDSGISEEDVISHFGAITKELEEEEEKERLLQERIDRSKELPITLDNIMEERLIASRSKMSYTVVNLKEICKLMDIPFTSKNKKVDLLEMIKEKRDM